MTKIKSVKHSVPLSSRERYEDEKATKILFQNSIRKYFSGEKLPVEEVLQALLLEYSKKYSSNASNYVFRNYVNAYLRVRDSVSYMEPVGYYNWRTKQTSSRSISGGLGIFVDGAILIQSVTNPEFKGKIFQGDRLIGINGFLFKNLSMEEISLLLKETKDEDINFDVVRPDGTSTKVRVYPKPREIVNVFSTKIEHKGLAFRYISLSNFQFSTSCNAMIDEVKKDIGTHISGYILDLRNNPGGDVDQLACIAAIFTGPDKVVMYRRKIEESAKMPLMTKMVLDFEDPKNKPIVLLVNGKSASASEGLAGALRYHRGARLVGQRTFGKGSVNIGTPWGPKQNIYLWKTEEIFYLPSHETHNRVGLVPDFVVPWRSGATPDEDFAVTSEFLDNNPTKPENKALGPKDSEQIKLIENCIDKNWLFAEERAHFGTIEESDYQKYFAQEVLRCSQP